MPFDLDFLTQIVDVHWDVDEQALLVTDFNIPLAVALDTGEIFSGVNSGASGQLLLNTFTVLSKGIVVYGKPRDGDACFMACVDGTKILRGFQKEDDDADNIVWKSVYTVSQHDGWGMLALSFAEDAFFVTYFIGTDRDPSGCAVSFDGTSFSKIGSLYGSVPLPPDEGGQTPGSVAYNGRSYATAGVFSTAPNYPRIIGSDDNMMWAASADGLHWSAGYTPDETTNPGIRPDSIVIGSGGSQAFTTIAGGAGRFVAAATSRSLFQSTVPVPGTGGEEFTKYVHPTAAAAVSSDGKSWTTVKLPGATEASYIETGVSQYSIAESVALSVAFIKTKKSDLSENDGYFVISANGSTQAGSAQTAASFCWEGDGKSWRMVKQAGAAGFGTVSAIAKDLSSTKIVRI